MSFDNRAFWDARYSDHPQLGSGRGSRGEVAHYKRALLNSILSECGALTVVDIGCGDMEIGSTLPDEGYTGIDISPIVVRRNEEMFPQKNFLCRDFESLECAEHDLAVCLDVLIHVPALSKYLALVRKMVRCARWGIVAAYDEPPSSPSEITFYHEPISASLRAAGAGHIVQIGAYHQVKVFFFGRHPPPVESNRADDTGLKQPVFLVGAMRSGTTLLAGLLGASPYVAHCRFELKDTWSKVGGIAMASPRTRDTECRELSAADAGHVPREALSQAFRAKMTALSGKTPGAVFLNKNPHLCNKLGMVDALFPDARYVWIHRCLPAVVSSMVRLFEDVFRRQSTRHVWPFSSPAVRNRCWQALHDKDEHHGFPAERIFPGGDVRFLAEYWLEANRAVADFFKSVNPSRRVEVEQEEFLVGPENSLARIMGSLRVAFHPSDCSRIETDRNSAWRVHLKQEEIASLCHFVRENADEINRVFGSSRNSSDLVSELSVDGPPLRPVVAGASKLEGP